MPAIPEVELDEESDELDELVAAKTNAGMARITPNTPH
jgi:hypothetical protein